MPMGHRPHRAVSSLFLDVQHFAAPGFVGRTSRSSSTFGRMHGVRPLTVLAASLLASGCHPHVHPPNLPAQMTPDQRLDIWRHWHSRGESVETTTTCNGNGCSSHSEAILELEGDVEVRHPEDLRPLIDERSESARALNDFAHARSTLHKWQIVGILGAAAFTGFGLGYMESEGENKAYGYATIGSGVVLVIAAIAGYVTNRDILEASIRTYDHYDESLMQRLNLCVRGLSIVPCEMDVPGTMAVPIDGADSAIQGLPQR
jgi:hypothetical protein